MPEDRSPPQEAGRESKPASKHKWRGKLFSTEGRFGRGVGDSESTDDDVANFLHSAATKAKARPQPAQLAPRIDTTAAPRSPSATDLTQSETVVDVYRKPKPRQNKGLRVTFQTVVPEIIGEGGDEAELPPREVSKSLRYAAGNEHTQILGLPRCVDGAKARGGRRPSPIPDDELTFQPKFLQRRPTGLSEIFDGNVLDNGDYQSDTSSLSTSVSPPPKSKSLPQPPLPLYQTESLRKYNAEARSDDTYPDIPPLTDQGYDSDDKNLDQERDEPGNSTSNYLGVPSPETLAINPVTPRPSPQPSSLHQEPQSSSYGFPSTVPTIHTTLGIPRSETNTRIQTTRGDPPVSRTKAFSLRQIAKSLGDDSLDDFDARVQRFNNLFRLGVSAHSELTKVPFVQWIRSACWWFLSGRQGLEVEVRSQSDVSARSSPSPTLKQAYVNLAKAWWIVKEVTPQHPEVTRFGKAGIDSLRAVINTFGNQVLAEQAEVHASIVANMRALTMSMKRNERLPPPDFEIQRLNLHVLLELPRLPSDIAGAMINNSTEHRSQGTPNIPEPFFPIPIGDTEQHFNFGRMFVEVSRALDNSKQDLRVPCILSVLRGRKEWGVQAAIASQDGQVNLIISDDMTGALSWRAAQWQIHSYEIALTIPITSEAQLKLQVKFVEKDFKTLWGIWDYTQRTKKSFSIRRDEELVFERTLQTFQCGDIGQFPAGPIPNCRLRLFEKKVTPSQSSAERTVHNGYRLTVITPPSMKTLSVVKYELGRENPILFRTNHESHTSELILRILPSSVIISPSFTKKEDSDVFRHLLSGTSVTKEDYCFPSLQLISLNINGNSTNEDSLGLGDGSRVATLPWSKIRIVRKGPPSAGHETVATGLMEIWSLAVSEYGTLTDRMSLAPGDLQIGLSINNLNELKFLRPPQSDMTWSLADERVSKEEIISVCVALKTMLTSTTARTYHFRSLGDLHSFQATITGFSVLFDGLASHFAISRRRTVVSVHKKWEASSARLQILKHDKSVQLVGFFRDFSHGTCMNFVLKVTDVFETFGKAGLFFLRIVDAKFALPKMPDDEGSEFICLDMPEYPSEHDDITIGFDNEKGTLQSLGSSLPDETLTLSQIEIALLQHCQLRSIGCPQWHPYEGKLGDRGWCLSIPEVILSHSYLCKWHDLCAYDSVLRIPSS